MDDLNVDESIILKPDLKNEDVSVWTGFGWLR